MKKIGIFGLARTGIAAYEYVTSISHPEFISGSFLKDRKMLKQAQHDKKGIICYDDSTKNRENFSDEFGSDSLVDIEDEQWTKLDYIILSPGVPLYFPAPHKIVEIANKFDIPLISDIELLYLDNPESNYIGVTGTNGKSTTTALIGHILSNDYVVAGNIGVPSLSVPRKSGYVLELSSYQLDLLHVFKANIAVLLNITTDHIDRHGSLANYIEAKKRIYRNMGPEDSLVIAIDNDITREIYNSIKDNAPFQIHPISIQNAHQNIPYNLYLQGQHNLENVLAAIEVAKILGYEESKIFERIKSFIGLKHRMEFIRRYKNIDFYNDSKATNADSAGKSLAALDNIYWIAGGESKEGGITSLVPLFSKVRKAYLFGKCKNEFVKTLESNNVDYCLYNSLEDAIDEAFIDAKKDNAEKVNILLAPAAASFDQFKNFEERGDVFRGVVLNLK